MNAGLIIPLAGNEEFARGLAAVLKIPTGAIETRAFPDGETYLRFQEELQGRKVALVSTLDRPDPKFLPLAFAAAAARELGAASVGLVAPYLAYMRQDRRFRPGEAVTSASFAKLLSTVFDWIVTVDPHLHRYSSLAAIYSVPTRAIHAAPIMAEWIWAHVPRPVIIGPDAESEQWVSDVATCANAPYRVLRKERRGDRDVAITLPPMSGLGDRRPVLVDDIASSGATMIEASRQLARNGAQPPLCVVVHALFCAESYLALTKLGAEVVSTNTVAHETNAIDMVGITARSMAEFL
jgi:ribose-phosphate pyrophosphokinase